MQQICHSTEDLIMTGVFKLVSSFHSVYSTNIYYDIFRIVWAQIHFRMMGYTNTGKFYIKVDTHVNCVILF